MMFALVPLLLIFPLAGLLLNLLTGRRWREPAAGVVATLATGLAFVVAMLLFGGLVREPAGAIITLGRWLQVGSLNVPIAFQVDTLSVTMALVVTGVGTLIHLYAIGYMQGDPDFSRFFIYLNLFIVAMLLLVLADNFLLLFVGWEGVGLCSFLLISFWFDRGENGTANASAGRKAFIANRVGDFGLIMAMTLLFWQLGTLSFRELFVRAEAAFNVGEPIVIAITLLLLLGVTGKSAQIPLFIWLPDAMAGPTPVSALIHAATMVTAGIYLMARTQLLFALAPQTQLVVALVGGATALLAALVAGGQVDIKRVLAYSTISQLGFMVAAAGLGAYTAAVFHLVTHAFFKALLFLAAGSVIHGLAHGGGHDMQDMRQMGGLRQRMPVTFAVYLVGALALAGLPPLAGFFSKDEILAAAWAGNKPVFYLLLLAALGTAYYMGRQICLVFLGTARSEPAAGAAESPRLMTGPLLVLAGLALAGGLLNLPGWLPLGHWLGETLAEGVHLPFNWGLAGTATLLALVGGGLAYRRYQGGPPALEPLAGWAEFVEWWLGLTTGRWIDDLTEQLVRAPYRNFSRWLVQADGAVFRWLEGGLAGGVRGGAAWLRRGQTGQLNWNVLGIVLSLVVLLLLLRWA